MKKAILILFLLISIIGFTQGRKTENIIIVTLDGMRWQEVFAGADSILLNNSAYTRNPESVAKEFWDKEASERRKKLFPFLWSVVESRGQLYGNRQKGNYVNNSNPYWFSYPGYNEIFTGFPDPDVNSNDKIYNKNENVLEFINKQKNYSGKVAAFCTWDVFPYILNAPRSGIYVNADVDTLRFANERLQLLNDLQFLTPRPVGVRPDVITYAAGREYLRAYKPKVLYIAFDETDDFAHSGMYDQYLASAYSQDRMIEDLWNTVQSLPGYKDKTTLVVTVDHGRGDKNKDQWKDHGQKVEDANQIWFAVLGPDSKHLGEVVSGEQLYQRQLASTIAALLGLDFKPSHSVGEVIKTVIE
ncbi:MAG: hypothetical protein JNK79_05230 [Chitinophagaceae bacterium]|nr:hypothetical protein [Chitinophagaceae bacterium]